MNSIDQCITYYEKQLTVLIKYENEYKDKKTQDQRFRFQRDLIRSRIGTMESILGLTEDEKNDFHAKIKKKLGI